MVDFSSVNLRITSPDGRTVLAELQTIDRVGQRAAKNIGTAHKEAFTEMSGHGALAARRLAGEMSMVAHEGAISARSLKQVAVEASAAAFAFGPTGVIAGAVALTGVAVFNFFKRTRDEIEETARKAREEIEKLARAGDLASTSKAAQYLYSGDPFAAAFGPHKDEGARDFEKRKLGILGIERQIAIQKLIRESGIGARGEVSETAARAGAEIERLTDLLNELRTQHTLVMQFVNQAASDEGYKAGKIVEGLRAQGQPGRDKTLEDLTRGIPGVGLVGKPFESIADMPGFAKAMLEGIQEDLKKTPPLPPQRMTEELQRLLDLQHVADQIGAQFGETLANGIANGIVAAVQSGGIGAGFRALIGEVLKGLGQLAITWGTAALAFSIKQKLWKDSVKFLSPEIGIGAALGLIALGAGLVAAGGAVGRSGGGGGYGGGSGGGYGSYPGTVYSLNPVNPAPSTAGLRAAQPVQIGSLTILSPRDPTFQRDIIETIKYATQRGGV